MTPKFGSGFLPAWRRSVLIFQGGWHSASGEGYLLFHGVLPWTAGSPADPSADDPPGTVWLATER